MLRFELDCFDQLYDEDSVGLPESMKLKKTMSVTPAFLKKVPERVLFYMFYNLPFDKQQLEAARELESRQWKYSEKNMRWSRTEGGGTTGSGRSKQTIPVSTVIFDPDSWEIVPAF